MKFEIWNLKIPLKFWVMQDTKHHKTARQKSFQITDNIAQILPAEVSSLKIRREFFV